MNDLTEEEREQLEAYEHLRGLLESRMMHKYEFGKERYGNGWVRVDPEEMLFGIENEVDELIEKVDWGDEGILPPLEEIADIANYAIMYAVRKKYE